MDADHDDFEAKLMSLKEVWDHMESQYLSQGVAPRFQDYILERVSNVKNCKYFLRNLCMYVFKKLTYLHNFVVF